MFRKGAGLEIRGWGAPENQRTHEEQPQQGKKEQAGEGAALSRMCLENTQDPFQK